MNSSSSESGAPGAIDLANLLILAGLVGVSAFVFGSLPDEIPVHFGADGVPDRFASTSWFSWMLLPLLAILLSGLFYGIGRLLVRIPDQLNVPDPKLYRALPMAEKQRVVALQQPFLGEILLGLNVMVAGLQLGAYQVAMGARPALPWYSWAVIGGFLLYTIVVCVRVHRRTRTLIRNLSESMVP